MTKDQRPMTESEALAEIKRLLGQLTDAEFDEMIQRLESALCLRAAVLGWTGDPLKQPASSVMAELRSVLSREAVS